MPTRHRYNDFFHRPEVFFAELMQKYVRGEFMERTEGTRVFHRALVVAVDVVGGRLENISPTDNDKVQHTLPNGQTVTVPANVGPTNPRNSIKARVLTDGQDQFYGDSKLRVFWPFMPEHFSVPIKPGEHAYVMFEDTGMTHGLWFGKVSGHEGLNFFPGIDSYKTEADDNLSSLFPDTSAGSTREPLYNTELEASQTGVKDGRLTKLFDGSNG